jgi:hypothetical protein
VNEGHQFTEKMTGKAWTWVGDRWRCGDEFRSEGAWFDMGEPPWASPPHDVVVAFRRVLMHTGSLHARHRRHGVMLWRADWMRATAEMRCRCGAVIEESCMTLHYFSRAHEREGHAERRRRLAARTTTETTT